MSGIVGRPSIYSRQPNVQLRIVGDGAVLVDIVSGHVFEVNRIGREIWDLIDGERDVLSVCNSIASRYQVEASVVAADVHRLIDDLIRARLISHVSALP